MAANLIPLQLDQSTGNLVAKQISGIYVPPSGTGFQFVTNGTPNTQAVTVTQATALLNLFTSSLQGLVPASGGGTTNFLRADGTWASPIVSSGVTSFNTRTGAVTLTSSDVNTALGYTAYNGVANPLGFLTSSNAVTSLTAGSGISVSASVGSVAVTNIGVISFNTRTGSVTLTSGDVTTALGFTPYNATNPAGYITQNQGFTVTGDVTGTYSTGASTLALTLPNITTPGTFGLVTVNAKGQVTTGSSPTTLAGYGITDGVATDVNTLMNSGISITFQGGGTATGLPTPVNTTDAANKAYVDAVAQGLTWKTAVKAATTANLSATYSGTPNFTLTANPSAVLPTFDGYAPNVGDRLLVKNQTTQSQNGIYVVTQTTAPWILTRSTDFDEITPIDEINGAAVYVEQGTIAGNTQWTQTSVVTTFDTSPITWTQLSSGGGGSVTSVAVTGSNGIGVTGSPITNSGTIALSLGAITPTSVAASGTVGGSNLSGTNTGDQTITLSGDVSGSGTGAFGTTLATVNGSPGTYSYATLTVNGKGLVTAASSGTAPVTSVTGTAGNITSTGGTTPVLNLATTGVSANTYTLATITVDSFGRITSASNGSAGSGTVTSVQLATPNTTLSITGTNPITSSGTINLDLPAQSSAGTYTNAHITVDGYGRVTAASNGTAPVTSVSGTAGEISSSGGTTPTVALVTTAVTPGSYTNTNLTVDSFGRITAATNGASSGTRTETVVWQYQTTSTTGFAGSPVSMTSGVASATGTSGGATSYTFTGYSTPPASVVAYGQVIIGSTFSWNLNQVMPGAGASTLTNDTGTVTSPGLITGFSSTPVLNIQLDGTVTNASTNTANIPYVVVVFKF